MNRSHWIGIFLLLLLTACNTTRFIPQGEYLLDKVTITMDDKGVDQSVLLPYVQQTPNSSKLGLGIYNLVNNDSNFIKKFIRKIGEPPVLLNNHLVALSVTELSMEMKNQGYLLSTVSARVDTTGKKAVVHYFVHNGEPYRIRNYTVDVPQMENQRPASNRSDTTPVRRSQRAPRERRFIREGTVFDLNRLEQERARVSSQLRNRGYYTFTEDNLHFLADTSLRSNQVDLTMVLTDTTRLLLPDTVRYVNVYSGYDPLAKEEYKIVDSLNFNGLHIYYDSLHFLRPRLIRDKVQVAPGQVYRERQSTNTYNVFQALNAVGRVDVQYAANDTDSTLLDCNIYLTPADNHSLQAGIEGTNKAGDLGVAVDINYGNANAFNGSEIFNIRLRGAYEFVAGKNNDGALVHNYYELGISPSLTFPQGSLPFIGRYMNDRYKTQVQYSLGYNVQRRPEYVRNFFNFKWQYNWATQQGNLSQKLSLLDVNYVNMPWQSDKFKEYLATEVDSLTKFSYDNVFTAGMGYSLIYTNAEVGRMRQNLYTIRFNAESSGNMLGWIFDA
jgi:outer membrane protein assembly factor BamA